VTHPSPLRALAPAALLAALAPLLPADVLVLDNGRKLSGDVSEKKETVTIRVEGQELVFGKDEVKAWHKSPADLIGDRAADVAAAKAIYQEALRLQDLNQQGAKMKEALAKANRAREAYAEARALFPEDRHADLDQGLVQISQLMRLIRERIGSGTGAAAPSKEKPVAAPKAPVEAPKPAALPPPPKVEPSALAKAFATLADPLKRAEPAARKEAEEAFAGSRGGSLGDLAAAGRFFLARESALAPDVAIAAQDHFAKQGMAEAAALAPERHLAAAKALAGPLKALAGKGAESLLAFAAGHLVAALAGPPADVETAARELGFLKSDDKGLWGPPEGLAARDLQGWLDAGMEDLGFAQLRKDYGSVRDFGVQYLIACLQLRDVLEKKMGHRRAAAAWVALASGPGTPAQRAHASAVAEALRKRTPCAACNGTHAVRCPVCRGRKKVNVLCPRCEGSGRLLTLRGTFPCNGCQAKGIIKDVECTKCKMTGEVECKGASCKGPAAPPAFEELFDAPPCAACSGSGLLTRRVPTRCPSCLGLGARLIPKTEPAKTLE
jgi:hypothetical protein